MKISNLKKMEINEQTNVSFDQFPQELFEIVGPEKIENEKIAIKSYSYWNNVLRIFLTKKSVIFSLILILMIIILAIIVPIGKIASPLPKDLPIPFSSQPGPLSFQYWFGLGIDGEDYWIKIWIGMRKTLIFASIIVAIQITVGLFIGSIWGYYRKTDIFFIEVIRFFSLVPSLILWLIVIFALGNNIAVIIFAVSITSWISLAQLTRVQIMLVRNTEYNLASKMLGTPGHKIISKNVMPKILPTVIQTVSLAIPSAIALDSSLSYFGFSLVQGRVETTMGQILNKVLATTSWQTYPHLLIIPVTFIAGTSFLFFIFGKTLSDSLDPKNHYN